MKFAMIFVAVALSAGAAKADCPDTEVLCHSMHTMSSELACLSGTAKPGVKCDSDINEATGLKATSKTARAAIEGDKEFAPDAATVAAIDATFDKLDMAIDHLILAVTAGDASAKATSLAEVIAVKKQGHMDFNK